MSSKVKKIKPRVFKSKVTIVGTLRGLLGKFYSASAMRQLMNQSNWIFTDFFLWC